MQQKVQDLHRVEVLPQATYSPDFALFDYSLFRSIEHDLRGQRFSNVKDVKRMFRVFFNSKPSKWYRHQILKLIWYLL